MIQQSHSWTYNLQTYNSKRYMRPSAHSSTLHNRQDVETTCMSISRWMDQEDVGCIHSGILLNHKKNEIMPFSATWMDLGIILLSEGGQTEKDSYHMVSLIREIWNMTQMILSTKQK